MGSAGAGLSAFARQQREGSSWLDVHDDRRTGVVPDERVRDSFNDVVEVVVVPQAGNPGRIRWFRIRECRESKDRDKDEQGRRRAQSLTNDRANTPESLRPYSLFHRRTARSRPAAKRDRCMHTRSSTKTHLRRWLSWVTAP